MSHIKYKVVPIDQVPAGVRYAPFPEYEMARVVVDAGDSAVDLLKWMDKLPAPKVVKFAIIDRTLDEVERMYKELCLESD